jgi:hypothetical protein
MLQQITARRPPALLLASWDAWVCRLEVLDLHFCGRGFGDRAAAAVAAAAPLAHLTRLRLSGAYRLQPPALLKVLAAAPTIVALDLPHCSWLHGPELIDVAEALPRLTRLDLSSCRGLAAEPLAQALGALPELASLCLGASGCPKFRCRVHSSCKPFRAAQHTCVQYHVPGCTKVGCDRALKCLFAGRACLMRCTRNGKKQGGRLRLHSVAWRHTPRSCGCNARWR